MGYLLVGTAVGPHALGWVPDYCHKRASLAEFGVVFLMFSIGLEFSLVALVSHEAYRILAWAQHRLWSHYACRHAAGCGCSAYSWLAGLASGRRFGDVVHGDFVQAADRPWRAGCAAWSRSDWCFTVSGYRRGAFTGVDSGVDAPVEAMAQACCWLA
jgi:hypothetical protein